jgi:hypothetical protein
MKIGIVCYPTFGGSGVVATELGHELCRAGHEVHFICYNQPARLAHRCPSAIQFHLVDVVSYPLFEFPPYDFRDSAADSGIHLVKQERGHPAVGNPDGEQLKRPLVRIAVDADGGPVPPPGTQVSLSDKDESGAYRRSIVKVTNAARYGITFGDYFV